MFRGGKQNLVCQWNKWTVKGHENVYDDNSDKCTIFLFFIFFSLEKSCMEAG